MKVPLSILSLLVFLVVGTSTTITTDEDVSLETFDYIVIGGGIGGGTIAHELSKTSSSVLLIEAGPDYTSPIISTPFYHYLAVVDDNISFRYPVQFYSSGYLADKKFDYFRVGSLGGCTRHNAMTAILPTSKDYQMMVEATEDESWSEKRIREEYFKPMERIGYGGKVDLEDHGVDGWFPIQTVDYKQQFNLDDTFDLMHRHAFEKNQGKFVDINGYFDKQKGILNSDVENQFLLPMSIDEDFKRYDFPKFIKSSKNLTVWTDTLVTKLVFDQSNQQIIEVEYTKGRYIYEASPLYHKDNLNQSIKGSVKVNKEVILAAGAFNSPQLLLLSGIGPKDELEEVGVEVKIDLPGVGKNLMDKSVTFIAKALEQDFEIYKECQFFTYNLTDPCYKNLMSMSQSNRQKHALYKEQNVHSHQKVLGLDTDVLDILPSPYISSGILSGELFKTTDNLEDPDIFMVNVPGSNRGPSILPPPPTPYTVQFNATYIKTLFKVDPQDKGYVKLNSKSPYTTPQINFNKFDVANNSTDLKALVLALKLARKQLDRVPNILMELVPGEESKEEEQLEKFIKENMTGFHICCTNKVGRDHDQMAVLDKEFKVRGTSNLRVVDASSFPTPPGYFPAVMTHIQSLKVAKMITEGNIN